MVQVTWFIFYILSDVFCTFVTTFKGYDLEHNNPQNVLKGMSYIWCFAKTGGISVHQHTQHRRAASLRYRHTVCLAVWIIFGTLKTTST